MTADLEIVNQGLLDEICLALSRYNAVPEMGVLMARKHQREITPRLVDSVRDAHARARAGAEVNSSLHLHALFLLAEFQAEEVWELVCEALRLSDDAAAYALYGDSIFENFPAFLAGACPEPSHLDQLSSDEALGKLNRQTVWDTYVFLLRDGKLTAEEVSSRFERFLIESMERQDVDLTTEAVCLLSSLGARETLPQIEDAFRKKLVDPTVLEMRHIKADFLNPGAARAATLLRLPPSGCTDALAYFQSWYRPPQSEDAGDLPQREDFAEPKVDLDGPQISIFEDSTVRRETARVGRNDPCSCGGGKKYKKCCGAVDGPLHNAFGALD